MKVARYSLNIEHDNRTANMEEDPNGEYVAFASYKTLHEYNERCWLMRARAERALWLCIDACFKNHMQPEGATETQAYSDFLEEAERTLKDESANARPHAEERSDDSVQAEVGDRP